MDITLKTATLTSVIKLRRWVHISALSVPTSSGVSYAHCCFPNFKSGADVQPSGQENFTRIQNQYLLVACNVPQKHTCSDFNQFSQAPSDYISTSSRSSRKFQPIAVSSRDQIYTERDIGDGGGSGGGDDNGTGGFGGGDSGGEDSSSKDDEEFGALLNAEQVQQEMNSRGVKQLPPDMLEAAQTTGISELLLSRYFQLQSAPWPLGPAINSSKLLRNRMLADPNFLFKLSAEIAIATGCATLAEMKQRGVQFWNEFELYLSDMLVGIALDIALVGLMAPFVQFGITSSTGKGLGSRLSRTLQALPSSMFEAQRPGRSFTSVQRISTLFYKGIQYGVTGFSCGIVGQGVASNVMVLKRKLKQKKKTTSNGSEDEVKVPDILQSAALWGVFMAVSANTRYQIVNGLESIAERSIVGRKMPQAAMLFTVGVRFANNIFGAMQFVDWARWAGIQ